MFMRFAVCVFLAVMAIQPAVLAAETPATATAKPMSMAVLDVQQIQRDSKAGKNIQGQVEKLLKSFQDEFAKQEEKLHAEDQELTKLRSTLSPEEFGKRQAAFQEKVIKAQRAAQKKRRQLEEGINTARQQLENSIVEVVGKIAEQRNLTVVLARNQVFLAQKSIDITKEVVAGVDAKVQSIPVKITEIKETKG
ncbi:MAG: OmpH family outer membrane protein [Dongiaceae bacterium]